MVNLNQFVHWFKFFELSIVLLCDNFSFSDLIATEFTLTHVDEYIDELLTKDYSCDIALPRIKKRYLKCNADKVLMVFTGLF